MPIYANMAQSFQDILSQVQAQSDPQRQAILGQIANLPNQQAADEASLGAQKDQAYQQILSGAQQRGIGFSGIPLQEQAQYDSTQYAPALAKLKSNYVTQQGTLESALAGIGSTDYSNALNQYNTEQDLAEKQREFDAQLAATNAQTKAANASNAAMASLLGGGSPQAPTPTIAARQGGGFNFADANGNAISAANYAKLTGTNIGTLLRQMGQAGDKYAQQAYNEISANQGYYNAHPDVLMREFSPLFWGS